MHDQQRTDATYSLQWNRFRILRDEEDRATFLTRTGFTTEDLRGRRVLDAGCGMGRYARVAATAGASVVGIDLSGSVRAARELATPDSDVLWVRGDLLRPPLAAKSFDLIYSIGVLDHTPNPRAAFLELARLLKPGGRIALWVYRRGRPSLERLIDLHRAVSTRLPLGVLLAASRLMAPIGGLKRRMMSSRHRLVERSGVALNLLTLGVSMHPDPEVRVCDTLDWYAPKYMSRHSAEEVAGWFREAGLVDVTDPGQGRDLFHAGQGNGVNLVGRRPVVVAPASPLGS